MNVVQILSFLTVDLYFYNKHIKHVDEIFYIEYTIIRLIDLP